MTNFHAVKKRKMPRTGGTGYGGYNEVVVTRGSTVRTEFNSESWKSGSLLIFCTISLGSSWAIFRKYKPVVY